MAANTNTTQSIMEINVLMLGGRRCGKTSILAAMRECFEKTFGNTDLTIAAADAETMMEFEKKRRELKKYYQDYYNGKMVFTPDDNATKNDVSYSFNISLKSKKNSRVRLIFTDIDGEYLNQHDKIDGRLPELIQKADVIMIAVDTPYLMEAPDEDKEAVGEYNEQKNRCIIITELIKNYFNADSNTNEKMILFVPLKCETYYWNGIEGNSFNLKLTAQKLKSAFDELLTYLEQENNRKYYEVAITPILTMGNVVFQKFRRKPGTPDYIMNAAFEYPNEPQYTLRESAIKNQVKKAEPQFCEQPFIYILLYMLRLTQKQLSAKEKSGGIFGAIVNTARRMLGYAFAEDFAAQQPTLLSQIKTGRPPHEECGFEIITDPIGLEEYV